MLYDPKWNQKTDAWSLTALISWLETMPPEKEYCYSDQGACLAATYAHHVGREYKVVMIITWGRPSKTLFEKVIETIAAVQPSTYGAALARARLTLSEDKWIWSL